MKPLKARQLFRNAWRAAVFLAVIVAAGGVHAQDQQQADRFLIIFETSPILKKNLPVLKEMLGGMFAGNLQNQIKTGDDLAVWTVDEKLHTGTFPLESWSPDEAAEYVQQLEDFLVDQKFRRSASLAPIQPLLGRIVKNSDHLTVLIFCDSESRLMGTPYDDGVNDIMTNATARIHGGPSQFIVVLRSYHGEYIGCSVNRSGQLNFPKFPEPAKAQPPPVVQAPPPPAPAPVSPATGPVVTPIQSLVIIGTNASTSGGAPPPSVAPATLATPAPEPTPPPVANPPAAIPPAPVAPEPTIPASATASVPPPAPTPVTPQPAPQNAAPAAAPETPVAANPAPAPSTAPQVTWASNTSTPAAAGSTTDTGYIWPLVIAAVAIVLAVGIVIWLITRSKRPQGSLITSSMTDDPRLPPRK